MREHSAYFGHCKFLNTVYFCGVAGALWSRKERERVGAGYSFGILLSVREAEARVLHVPHCGRDSASIAPYIALTVLFCPGCALKNNAVQPRPVRRLKLRRRASRECDLKIPFNFRRVLAASSEKKKKDSNFAFPSLEIWSFWFLLSCRISYRVILK